MNFAGSTIDQPKQSISVILISLIIRPLAQALQMSYTTYLKTERDQRELSFLMTLRICQFYKIDLHEFVSMLSDEERPSS
ncbi:MAG: hypothetical protein WKF97_24525 [Chitinophagaceae bacterium]